MQTVSIHNAKTNLSKYIAAVKNGEKVFIGGFGKPEVLLVLASPADIGSSQKRNFSIAHNKVAEKPDSFTDETNALIEQMLAGSQE